MNQQGLKEFKTAGTVVSTTANVASGISNAYTASRIGGAAIFKSSNDIDQMTFIVEQFKKIYDETAKITTRIPDCFMVEDATVSGGFLWLFKVPAITVRIKLIPLDLKTFHSNCIAESFLDSPLYPLSRKIIAHGSQYVEQRENSKTRRSGFSPFSNVLVPRYYFIYFISLKALELGKYEINDNVVDEYNRLRQFLISIDEGKNEHFKKSSDDNGFYSYLSTAIECASNLHEVAKSYLKREPIGDKLKKLGNTLIGYEDNLVNYFVRCISDVSTPHAISVEQLKSDTRMLERSFAKSFFYKAAHVALTKERSDLDEVLKNIEDALPSELKAINYKELISNFKMLAILLMRLRHRRKHYYEIGCAVLRFGEDTFVKNDELKWIIEANSLIIKSLLLQCEKVIKKNEIKLNVVRRGIRSYGDKNYFANNSSAAKHLANALETIRRENIENKLEGIKNRLTSLLEENMPNIKTVTSSLIRETRNMFEDDLNAGVSFTEEAKQYLSIRLKTELNYRNAIEIKQSTKSNLVLIQDNFSSIYSLLEHKPEKWLAYVKYIQQIDSEYDQLFEFISKIELINKLALKCYRAIQCAEKNSSGNVTDACYQRVTELFNSLVSEIQACKYHEYSFTSFQALYDCPQLFLNKKKEIFLAIRKLLNQENPNISDKERENLFSKVSTGISSYFNDSLGKLDEKREVILENLSWWSASFSKSSFDINVIEHMREFKRAFKLSYISVSSEHVATQLTEIEILVQKTAETTCIDTLRINLKSLYEALLKKVYHLHYFGGEDVTFKKNKYRVPYHIKQILKTYEKMIPNPHSLDGLIAIRDKIYSIAMHASDNPPSYCCGLFNPRNCETQELYISFKKAHDQNIMNNTL